MPRHRDNDRIRRAGIGYWWRSVRIRTRALEELTCSRIVVSRAIAGLGLVAGFFP
jgi:hypothetical protein